MRSVVRRRSELFLETPASGSQESPAGVGGGRGGGEWRGRTRPLSRGRAPRPRPPPRGEGREGARGGGEGEGQGNGGGGGFPPHPTPASRTTGSRCCPLPPTEPRTPRSCPAPRGASGEPQPPGPWEPEPRLIRTDRFPVRKLPVTLEKPFGPTWSQPELATFHYSPVTSLLL